MLSTLTSTDASVQSQLFRFAAPDPERAAFFPPGATPYSTRSLRPPRRSRTAELQLQDASVRSRSPRSPGPRGSAPAHEPGSPRQGDRPGRRARHPRFSAAGHVQRSPPRRSLPNGRKRRQTRPRPPDRNARPIRRGRRSGVAVPDPDRRPGGGAAAGTGQSAAGRGLCSWCPDGRLAPSSDRQHIHHLGNLDPGGQRYRRRNKGLCDRELRDQRPRAVRVEF